MISSLYRYPKSMRRNIASVWGKRGAVARAELRAARGIDAETAHRRALDDARGQVLREGRTYSADGVKHWRVIRSVRGRTNQRDVLVNGELFKTCGLRRLPAWLR
jgi:hypothetical protein